MICLVRTLRRRHFLSPLLCVCLYLFLQYSRFTININLTIDSFLAYCLIFLSVGLHVTHCLSPSVVPYLLSEKHIGRLCCPCLCWPESLEATMRPCQENAVFAFERNSMHECAHPYVRIVHVCVFICGVVLPFPVLGMFKASSCAVRMCLSLFSKNTCSAFYQRAELGRPGAVQG